MVCASCGTENRADRRFCVECGAPLAAACPSCGAPVEPGEKFCGTCGARLAPAASAARMAPGAPAGAAAGGGTAGGTAGGRPPEPVAERRLVSVLFVDLVGFTPFAEERDAEEVRATLTRYFDLASEVVARYGGTVEKFIGDAVMAVWGVPVAHEDDAERAVRAGLELVGAVRSLGEPMQARAGILTGEAAVTLGAANQGMVAGDLVNTAGRLQSVAPPGGVLVGEATRRAAGRAIAFEPAGEQLLRGKSAPVPAWRAVRVVAEVGGRNRSEALEAPFVGRDDELRLLKDLFHATAREGRARLVSVVGPGGIGKTRLAWEFLKYLDGVVESAWYHDGRSPAYGEGITFWALGEMVRRRAGLRETDDEATTRAGVAAMLEEHVPDADERRWIEPAMLALLGLESRIGPEELFGAWRTFFERLAATAPVVMVFEDFHFADSGLLDFVDHLMDWSRAVPIYVVTLARPELLEKRETWGAGKRNFTSLYLEPLPAAAMGELLAGLVPGLPEATAGAIVARADGIPLYAVETVRMLLAEGRLVADGDAYRPVGDLGALAVPETLTALIASRLDALPADDRALVSDAAVLGQTFTSAGLAAVAGRPAEDLEAHLRSLVRREILRVEADQRSPERGQHAFVQALIREVAYNRLARADRKARHLAAARFFESLGSDELAGALAGHYLAAHAAAREGPERDALAGQARLALRAAGERAAGLGAHDQAVAFFEQARSIARDAADEADLLEAAGRSLVSAGRHTEAEGALRRALDMRRAAGDRRGAARAAAVLARNLLDAPTSGRMDDDIGALVEEFADLAADVEVVALRGQEARAALLMGHERAAIAKADAVLEDAERLDLVEVIADTLVTRGAALVSIGREREGLGTLEAGLRLADEHGLHGVALRARGNFGFVAGDRDPRRALEVLQEGIRLARRLGELSLLEVLVSNLSGAAFFLGEPDLALAEIETFLAGEPDSVERGRFVTGDAIFHWALRGDPVDERIAALELAGSEMTDPHFVASLGEIRSFAAFARGDDAVAEREIRAAAQLVVGRAPANLGFAARYAIFLGDLAAARGDRDALAALGHHGPALANRLREADAGIAALEGRSGEALALYRDVLERWDALGMVVDGAICRLEMAAVLDPAEPAVRAAADAARATFVRLRAKPFLARLDAVLARRSAAAPAGPARAPAADPRVTTTLIGASSPGQIREKPGTDQRV